VSLNQWLVREGWALNFEPYAKGRIKADEDEAREKEGGFGGAAFHLRSQRGVETTIQPHCWAQRAPRAKLARYVRLCFRKPLSPPGCSIEGKLAARAHFTGHLGIYHMEGCRSYVRTKRPDRWFCSEDEAQAEGFRKAFTCR
jgi:hypothetical protein